MGKENEAVDLLVQKKKLTKALENIKERIEVPDKLSAKIRTSIGENSGDKIRVFSSTIDDGVNGAESSDSRPKSVEKESFELRNEAHASMAGHPEQRAFQMADSFTFLNDPDSIKNPSAYDKFLEHIDLQMKSLEYETEQFISSQSVEEVGSWKQRNDKWQRLSDIQMLVKESRERIVRILDDCKRD